MNRLSIFTHLIIATAFSMLAHSGWLKQNSARKSTNIPVIRSPLTAQGPNPIYKVVSYISLCTHPSIVDVLDQSQLLDDTNPRQYHQHLRCDVNDQWRHTQ